MQNLDMITCEHQILDIICKCYDKRYVGKLKIAELHPGYDVALFLGTDYQPIHIAAALSWDDYLNYFESEVRKRHLSHDKYYTGYQTNVHKPHEMNPDIEDDFEIGRKYSRHYN